MPSRRPNPAPCAIHPGEALLQAARRGDADKLLQAGCIIVTADAHLVCTSADTILKAILSCRPQAIPALAFVLRELARRQTDWSDALRTIMLFRMPRDAAGFKVLSVMAEAGFDLSCSDYAPADVRDLQAHHAHLAATPAGTLASLCTLLMQSPLKPFHGRSYRRFPGDLSVWRPFIHGRFGVLWAMPVIIAVLGLAVAALALLARGLTG